MIDSYAVINFTNLNNGIMKVEDLEIYNLSMDFSDKIWHLVIKWDYFAKDTIGKQWVRAADSVDANISEGFGRFTAKDSKNFYIIARGSLQESRTWLKKAFRRNLISENEFNSLSIELGTINLKLSRFLKAHSKRMENK